MINLYGCAKTRSTRAVWALEEAGAEYRYIPVDLHKGEGRKTGYLRINPAGKVPALVEDDFVLTESAAIVTFVGDRYPDSRLTPKAGTRERAHYDQWCFFALCELEQPLWTMAKHTFALPEEWRVPAAIDTARKEFDRVLRLLEHGLGNNTYILGDGFTGADILIASILAWARKAEVPIESEKLLAYMGRCLSRPALDRARQREAVGLT